MVADFLEGSRPSHLKVLEAEVRKNSPSNPPHRQVGIPKLEAMGRKEAGTVGRARRDEFVLFS